MKCLNFIFLLDTLWKFVAWLFNMAHRNSWYTHIYLLKHGDFPQFSVNKWWFPILCLYNMVIFHTLPTKNGDGVFSMVHLQKIVIFQHFPQFLQWFLCQRLPEATASAPPRIAATPPRAPFPGSQQTWWRVESPSLDGSTFTTKNGGKTVENHNVL